MKNTLAVLAHLLACSPPSRPAPPQKAVDAAPADAPPPAPPDAPPQPYAFPWDSLRRWFENVAAGKTPCDFRHDLRIGKVGTGDCTPPVQMAAKVQLMKLVLAPDLRAKVSVDFGSDEGVGKDWYGALVDDQGHLVTSWEHPDTVQLHQSFLTFQVKDERVRALKHAALVKVRP